MHKTREAIDEQQKAFHIEDMANDFIDDVIVPKGTFCEFCKEVPTREQDMLCSECLMDIQNC
jgi:hypothetical protein